MKVKELIEELKKFDPDMEVKRADYVFDDADIEEVEEDYYKAESEMKFFKKYVLIS
jgi:hypothetical protein